eukprot:3377280-Rhodomonas_salina.1
MEGGGEGGVQTSLLNSAESCLRSGIVSSEFPPSCNPRAPSLSAHHRLESAGRTGNRVQRTEPRAPSVRRPEHGAQRTAGEEERLRG